MLASDPNDGRKKREEVKGAKIAASVTQVMPMINSHNELLCFLKLKLTFCAFVITQSPSPTVIHSVKFISMKLSDIYTLLLTLNWFL